MYMEAAEVQQEIQEQFGIVVMLDVLGVSNYTMAECKQFIQKLKDIISFAERIHKSMCSSAEKGCFGEMGKNVSNPLKNVIISQFGDTLVMAWPVEKKYDANNLLTIYIITGALSALIHSGLIRQIALRGCISVGEYVWADNNKTILGPAIFDANSWYNSADWFGVIFSPKTRIWLSSHREMKEVKDHPDWIPYLNMFICDYCVPLTEHAGFDNHFKEFSVVAWPGIFLYCLDPDQEQPPKQELYQYLSNMPMPKGVESKYKNSVDFFNWYDTNVFQKNPNLTS